NISVCHQPWVRTLAGRRRDTTALKVMIPSKSFGTDRGPTHYSARCAGCSCARAMPAAPAKLCRDAARREFDMVMAWSVDRLGRSLQDLVGFLSELHALKIDPFLRQQGLDTTTPAGKAMFQMLGVFAEFERAMIAERVRAGLALIAKKIRRGT